MRILNIEPTLILFSAILTDGLFYLDLEHSLELTAKFALLRKSPFGNAQLLRLILL